MAEHGGGDEANCDRTAIGSWEKLLRIDFSDGIDDAIDWFVGLF